MPSPTMERGLLRIFPRGADPTTTDHRATTSLVQLPTSFSLQAISAAGAGGRGAWGGASDRKSQRDSRGRSTGKGGRNETGKGQTRGE